MARVPGMGMNKSEEKNEIEKMTGSSDSNRSESQGGDREGLSTKEGRSKGNDRRNTNRQRGRMRAISVLGNAKSNRHRKTHQVEPGGTGPQICSCTLPGEISAARAVEKSAEAVVVKRAVETRKERRAEEQPREQPKLDCITDGEEMSEMAREWQQRQLPKSAREESADGVPRRKLERITSRGMRERRRQGNAQ